MRFQVNIVKARVITDSFVIDSVLVWQYQVRITLKLLKGSSKANGHKKFGLVSSCQPLHPSISIHILHTLNFIFLFVLTRRIHLAIKAF